MLALFAPASRGFAEQKQKHKKSDPAERADSNPPLNDTQAIDVLISQMLAAWQVGDVDGMHKFYADDVVTVSGAWEPPLLGWENYARAYKTQRARVQSGRLDRINTYTKLMGDSAWVTYQWEFAGLVDDKRMNADGHTTLVLQKRAGNWVIILNHTSSVPDTQSVPTVTPSPTSHRLPPGI